MKSLRGLSMVLAMVAVAGLGGCLVIDPPPPRDGDLAARAEARAKSDAAARAAGYTITADELDQLTSALADTFVARMASACDQVVAQAASSEVRADAQYLKLVSAVSAYDIVTEIDSFSQLLDLTTMLDLQVIVWVDEGGALKRFGPAGQGVADALKRSQAEMSQLGARVLKPEQLALLKDQARAWRAANPEVMYVAMVRFDEAASERARTILADVPKGSGLLAPVAAASDNLELARKFAERAFYLGKRLPLIIGWQADDTVNRFVMKKELRESLQALSQTAAALRQSAQALKDLPGDIAREREATMGAIEAQRAAIFASLDERRAAIDAIVRRLESTLVSSAKSIEGVDTSTAKLAGSVQRLGDAVKSASGLLAQEVWAQRVSEIDSVMSDRVKEITVAGRAMVDYGFWRGVILIGVALVAAIVYRAASFILQRRAMR